MAENTYDFGGWATKNDLKCADGRTIRRDAFKECDGKVVPLVWQHMHNDPENVLGHALLKNTPDGVRAYGKFNDTEKGKVAKMLVEHGDIEGLSIWANQLKQRDGDVLHGKIREVSLVLSGANPGALIDFPILEHGESESSEAVIYTGEDINTDDLEHFDMEENEEEDMHEEDMHEEDFELEHADDEEGDETVKDVFDTLNEKQKKVVYALIGAALDKDDDDDEDDEEDEKGEDEMKHNVFESEETNNTNNYLSHSDMEQIFRRAKGLGSLREAVLEYTDNQGIELMHDDDAPAAPTPYGIQQRNSSYSNTTYGIDALFPDYRNVTDTPEFISRNMDWVNAVMSGVSHSPFTRIRSMFADITADEARAKGYTKGNRKIEEVFTLLKRTTDPQTIYKKQKLDRDDIVDITDFDIVAWLKKEMRVMLNEEIARAILIGDGRSDLSEDRIFPQHIRPIATDDDLFTIKVNTTETGVPATDAKEQIKAIIRARKNYKGSGNPVFFTTEDVLTEMLLIEDEMGHTLYKTEAELATKLRVSKIVTVEVMENQTISNKKLLGVIVNLKDYRVGTDRGGEVNMFDDFDIDYNQQKYLMETRMSGALVKPFSAMVVTATVSAGNNNAGGAEG